MFNIVLPQPLSEKSSIIKENNLLSWEQHLSFYGRPFQKGLYVQESKQEAIKLASVLTNKGLASHKRTLANSVNQDKTPQNTASDEGLLYLH